MARPRIHKKGTTAALIAAGGARKTFLIEASYLLKSSGF